ncbi:hypothetical protein D3C78_1481580 [compost metagenome]
MASRVWSSTSAILRKSSASPPAQVQGLWIISMAFDAITRRWAPQAATLPALAARASIRAVQRSPRRFRALWMANPSKRSPPMVLKATVIGDLPSSMARRS